MAPELVSRIRSAYMSGLTLVQVQHQFDWLPRRDVRMCLEGAIRSPGHQSKSDLSEEEVARRRDEIKAGWTPEQARLRWVGRYLSRPEYLGSCLSKALRDMGGDA